MKKALKSKLPDHIVTNSVYSAMRLKDKFNIKIKTVKEHQHDIIYYVECPEENYNENVDCRKELLTIMLRIKTLTYLITHSVERKHRPPNLQKFSILGGIYRNNKFRRKVAYYL